MKKLIQILIVCGLVVFMGGTASGEEDNFFFMTGDESVEEIMNVSGCPLCHTISGIKDAIGTLGPALTINQAENSLSHSNYKGKAKTLKEYIKESILYPNLYITYDAKNDEPYLENLMPDYYRQRLSDKALNKIIDHLANKEIAVQSAKSTVNCSSEKDSLKRLTCYDNLPENLKNKKCSSVSDSLKRLSCFESENENDVAEETSEETTSGETIKEAEEKANVVIKILDGTPYFDTKVNKDEFGDLEGHEIESGCTYLLEIENKTSYQIKVNPFFLASDKTYVSSYDASGMPIGAAQNHINAIFMGKIMKPNSKFEFTKPVTYWWISKSKDSPNEEEKNKFIKKYGCDSHEEGLYIGLHVYPTLVKYHSSSGISDPLNKHIIGSSEGAYPLQKEIKPVN